MQIYESKSRPGTIIHLPTTIDELKSIFPDHNLARVDASILLAGGLVNSSKKVGYDPMFDRPWHIYHEVDDTATDHTDRELEDTLIHRAMATRNFLVTIKANRCKCQRTS